MALAALAEWLFDEMKNRRGMMKLVLDPNMRDDQFMTNSSQP
jgi:hypothetical protein